MAKTPKSLLSIPALLLHVIGIPVFYLGFILIYESQWMARFLDGGNANRCTMCIAYHDEFGS